VNREDEDSDFTLNFSLKQGYGSLEVTVDGDSVKPVKNGNAYSLTVKIVNHLEIGISAGKEGESGYTGINRPALSPASLYPGLVKAGQAFYVNLPGENPNGALSVHSLSGIRLSGQKISNRLTECIIDQKGIYLIEVKQNEEKYIFKVIVS
jgi:hypothetical protein